MSIQASAETLPAPPESEWPDHVAKVPRCPCTEAQPTSGVVYRRYDGTPDSNKSYAELEKQVAKHKRCQATSLSCYLNKDHLQEILHIHEEWADQQIVQAELAPMHGLILQTGEYDPEHYSLWLRKKYLDQIDELFMVSQ